MCSTAAIQRNNLPFLGEMKFSGLPFSSSDDDDVFLHHSQKKSYEDKYIHTLYRHFHDDLHNKKMKISEIRDILLEWKLNYCKPLDLLNIQVFTKDFQKVGSQRFFLSRDREEENCPYFECSLLLHFAKYFRSNKGCFFSKNQCGETCQSCKTLLNLLFSAECHHFYRWNEDEKRDKRDVQKHRHSYQLFKIHVFPVTDEKVFREDEKEFSRHFTEHVLYEALIRQAKC